LKLESKKGKGPSSHPPLSRREEKSSVKLLQDEKGKKPHSLSPVPQKGEKKDKLLGRSLSPGHEGGRSARVITEEGGREKGNARSLMSRKKKKKRERTAAPKGIPSLYQREKKEGGLLRLLPIAAKKTSVTVPEKKRGVRYSEGTFFCQVREGEKKKAGLTKKLGGVETGKSARKRKKSRFSSWVKRGGWRSNLGSGPKREWVRPLSQCEEQFAQDERKKEGEDPGHFAGEKPSEFSKQGGRRGTVPLPRKKTGSPP